MIIYYHVASHMRSPGNFTDKEELKASPTPSYEEFLANYVDNEEVGDGLSLLQECYMAHIQGQDVESKITLGPTTTTHTHSAGYYNVDSRLENRQQAPIDQLLGYIDMLAAKNTTVLHH